jgi:hypothetical protein
MRVPSRRKPLFNCQAKGEIEKAEKTCVCKAQIRLVPYGVLGARARFRFRFRLELELELELELPLVFGIRIAYVGHQPSTECESGKSIFGYSGTVP